MIHLWLKGFFLTNVNPVSDSLVYRFVFYSILHHPRLSARSSWIYDKDMRTQVPTYSYGHGVKGIKLWDSSLSSTWDQNALIYIMRETTQVLAHPGHLPAASLCLLQRHLYFIRVSLLPKILADVWNVMGLNAKQCLISKEGKFL